MYQNCIREVYHDLMAMNVGAKNIEHVIRTVLSKLTAMDAKEMKLPQERRPCCLKLER